MRERGKAGEGEECDRVMKCITVNALVFMHALKGVVTLHLSPFSRVLHSA